MNTLQKLISVVTATVAITLTQPVLAEKSLSASPDHKKPIGLLLPAVQKAREASRSPRRIMPQQGFRSTRPSGSSKAGANTSCSGVNSCNDMIATCLSLGGNVTPTSYDPDSGAPNGATCYSPGS